MVADLASPTCSTFPFFAQTCACNILRRQELIPLRPPFPYSRERSWVVVLIFGLGLGAPNTAFFCYYGFKGLVAELVTAIFTTVQYSSTCAMSQAQKQGNYRY